MASQNCLYHKILACEQAGSSLTTYKEKMNQLNKHIAIYCSLLFSSNLFGQQLAQLNDFQLAAPLVQFESQLFQEDLTISASVYFPDAYITYTIDASEPNADSEPWNGSLTIAQNTLLKVQAFHPECRASELIEIPFFKVNAITDIQRAKLAKEPSPKYPGKGAKALFDLKKGSLNFRESAWMGFEGEEVEVHLEFQKKRSIQKVTASVLEDHASWIFAPSAMIVWISKDGKNYEKVEEQIFPLLKENLSSGLKFLSTNMDEIKTKYLKIQLKSIPAIPEWHQGSGGKGWLFIDEILID